MAAVRGDECLARVQELRSKSLDDFLQNCLKVDHKERPTAKSLLRHQFILMRRMKQPGFKRLLDGVVERVHMRDKLEGKSPRWERKGWVKAEEVGMSDTASSFSIPSTLSVGSSLPATPYTRPQKGWCGRPSGKGYYYGYGYKGFFKGKGKGGKRPLPPPHPPPPAILVMSAVGPQLVVGPPSSAPSSDSRERRPSSDARERRR